METVVLLVKAVVSVIAVTIPARAAMAGMIAARLDSLARNVPVYEPLYPRGSFAYLSVRRREAQPLHRLGADSATER